MDTYWQHPQSYVLRSLEQTLADLYETRDSLAHDLERRFSVQQMIWRLEDEISAREGL